MTDIDLLHEIAINYDYLRDEIIELKADGDLVSWALLDEFSELAKELDIVADNVRSRYQHLDRKHGGVRAGAGRKKQSPTVQVRVDADLSDLFKTISIVYRSADDKKKCLLVERLNTVH